MKQILCFFALCASFTLPAQVVWDKTYTFPGASYVNDMVETTDGQYFVVCPYSYFKVSKAGDTLFTSQSHFSIRGSISYGFTSCASLPNGEVVLGGRLGNLAYVWIIGKEGELKHVKSYLGATTAVDLLSNDSLVYVAFDTGKVLHKTNQHLDSLWSNFPQPIGTPLAMTFDHKGNIILMTNQYSFTSHSVYDGGYYNVPKKPISGTYNSSQDISLVEMNNQFYFSKWNKLVGLSIGFDSLSTHVIDSSHYFNLVPEASGFTALVSLTPGWVFRTFTSSFSMPYQKSFVGMNDYKDHAHILKDSEGYYLFGGDAQFGGNSRLLRYKSEQVVTALETDPFKAKGFTLFPNPAKNEVWLHIANVPATITVLNGQGRIMLQERQEETTPSLMLDRTHLPAGIYVVEVEDAAHQVRRSKLVLE